MPFIQLIKEKKVVHCVIADLDFEVLRKKGLDPRAIERLNIYYKNSITIPIVNNIPGIRIINKSLTLRQGDCPSSTWFGYGIDPLLVYLQNRLAGILIHSLPVLGPTKKERPKDTPSLEQRYTVVGYCEDLKPAISNRQEFYMIN